MKKNRIILNISNPCHQNWEEMGVDGVNRFCAQCTKYIVDFSTLADHEIIEKINLSNGKICGRVAKLQLNKPIVHYRAIPIFSGLYKLLASFLLLVTSKNTDALPANVNAENIENHIQNKLDFQSRGNKYSEPIRNDSLPNAVEGIIIDSRTKEQLIGVIVKVKNTKDEVLTDFDGRFKLAIPDSLDSDSIWIQISYTGYEAVEYFLDKKLLPVKKSDKLVIRMDQDMILGELIIIQPDRKNKQKRKDP